MDDNAKTNLVNKFYDTIVKRTNKERRENLIPPTPQDFFECWLLAIEMAQPVILKPRSRADHRRKVQPWSMRMISSQSQGSNCQHQNSYFRRGMAITPPCLLFRARMPLKRSQSRSPALRGGSSGAERWQGIKSRVAS